MNKNQLKLNNKQTKQELKSKETTTTNWVVWMRQNGGNKSDRNTEMKTWKLGGGGGGGGDNNR